MSTSKKIDIKLIVLDIDGVLTDGKVAIDTKNNEYKTLNYRDIDSINLLRQSGIGTALLTGEDTILVDIIANRLRIDNVSKGAKDKEKILAQISENTMIPLENICYVGDTDRDAGALKLCGLGIVPQDATSKARDFASVILKTSGGKGVVYEIVEYLVKNNYIKI